MMRGMYDTKISIRLDYITECQEVSTCCSDVRTYRLWLVSAILFCDGSSRFREIKVAKASTHHQTMGGRVLVEHFEKKYPS